MMVNIAPYPQHQETFNTAQFPQTQGTLSDGNIAQEVVCVCVCVHVCAYVYVCVCVCAHVYVCVSELHILAQCMSAPRHKFFYQADIFYSVVKLWTSNELVQVKLYCHCLETRTQ